MFQALLGAFGGGGYQSSAAAEAGGGTRIKFGGGTSSGNKEATLGVGAIALFAFVALIGLALIFRRN